MSESDSAAAARDSPRVPAPALPLKSDLELEQKTKFDKILAKALQKQRLVMLANSKIKLAEGQTRKAVLQASVIEARASVEVARAKLDVAVANRKHGGAILKLKLEVEIAELKAERGGEAHRQGHRRQLAQHAHS